MPLEAAAPATCAAATAFRELVRQAVALNRSGRPKPSKRAKP
jgi:D-arabinose 1-dehydrogenase-like Zn-dependent alcohol dehydrogenase